MTKFLTLETTQSIDDVKEYVADVMARLCEKDIGPILQTQVGKLLYEYVENRKLLVQAAYILGVHAGRCDLNPLYNFSGMESHLAMYRHVLRKSRFVSGPLTDSGYKFFDADQNT